jgi:hypothetical protein
MKFIDTKNEWSRQKLLIIKYETDKSSTILENGPNAFQFLPVEERLPDRPRAKRRTGESRPAKVSSVSSVLKCRMRCRNMSTDVVGCSTDLRNRLLLAR